MSSSHSATPPRASEFHCCAHRAAVRSVRRRPVPPMVIGGYGPLHRLGLAARVGEPDVLAGEVGNRLGQQHHHRLDALVEPVEALLQRRQRDAVGVALHLVPARADAELEAAAGHDVHRGGHVGQHGRVPVDHAGDLAADPDPPRRGCHGAEHGPGLEVRPGHVAGQRVEVVPVPRRLEQRELVGREPRVADLFPGLVLGPCLDREPHCREPFPRNERNEAASSWSSRDTTLRHRRRAPPQWVTL